MKCAIFALGLMLSSFNLYAAEFGQQDSGAYRAYGHGIHADTNPLPHGPGFTMGPRDSGIIDSVLRLITEHRLKRAIPAPYSAYTPAGQGRSHMTMGMRASSDDLLLRIDLQF